MTPRKPVMQRSPDILGGTPVFAGTHIPVKTLIDYLEAGDRLEDFLQDFPTVTREQAMAALEIAKEALLHFEVNGHDESGEAGKRGEGTFSRGA